MDKVFISFQHDDEQHRRDLESRIKNPNWGVEITPVSALEDKRNEGEDAVRHYLRGLMSDVDTVIFLLGRNAHQSKWVDYEISVANSLQKNRMVIRVPGVERCQLPPNLDRSLKSLSWEHGMAEVARRFQNG